MSVETRRTKPARRSWVPPSRQASGYPPPVRSASTDRSGARSTAARRARRSRPRQSNATSRCSSKESAKLCTQTVGPRSAPCRLPTVTRHLGRPRVRPPTRTRAESRASTCTREFDGDVIGFGCDTTQPRANMRRRSLHVAENRACCGQRREQHMVLEHEETVSNVHFAGRQPRVLGTGPGRYLPIVVGYQLAECWRRATRTR